MSAKFHIWLVFSFKNIEKVYVILDRPSYLYVSFSGLIISVWEERATLLQSFTCNFVVSVRRGFLFLLVVLSVLDRLCYFIVALLGPSI